MTQLSINSCESLNMKGILKQISFKKDGRVAKFRLQKEDGICEIKASKYLRLGHDYTPRLNDFVELKVLKKMKAGRIKLKAFEIVLRGSAPPPSWKKLDHPIACKSVDILLCQSSKCKKHGAKKLLEKLEKELAISGRDSNIRLTSSKCLGKCKKGPAAKILPSGMVYSRLDAPAVLRLLS